MYIYDAFDRRLLAERVTEFRDQVARRLSGELTEEEFKPLRLMNGVYLQLHAYMLRIAIPYGTLSTLQLRKLAEIARKYDRGYGHFTTRQNIQFHWIKLAELPDAMAELASVGMHGMQTSGNNVRNITTDQWAGVAPDEIEDPRVWAELIRQHVTLHPEFSFMPRKFKIAVGASIHDRAALRIHDMALRLHRNAAGEGGFEVMVGGGLGRTPYLAQARRADRRFDLWIDNCVANHKTPGYAIVTLALKPEGGTPGDCTAAQMDRLADLADRYSFGEVRVGHEQNLALPHVAQRDLPT